MRVTRQWCGAQLFRLRHQFLNGGIRGDPRSQQCPVAVCFDRERQLRSPSLVFHRSKFDAVIEIEVARTILGRQFDLRTIYVVLIAVHNCPDGLLVQWPTASVDTVTQHWGKWLPIGAYEKWGNGTFDCSHASRGFSISRSDPIPDAPDVLPAFPAHSVEECKLQVVGLVAFPAIRDIYHVPRFQPFVFVDHRYKRKLILPPGHHVPSKRFVSGTAFRLECQRVSDLVGSCREGEWHSILGVAIDAVGSDLRHQLGNGIRPIHARISGSLVPHHHWEQHANAAAMEISNHSAHSFDPARHIPDHVLLIAIVNSHVWVRRPNEHGVDATVSFLQVVKIPVDRVAMNDWIIEIPVLDHHLRLEETRLSPLEGSEIVS